MSKKKSKNKSNTSKKSAQKETPKNTSAPKSKTPLVIGILAVVAVIAFAASGSFGGSSAVDDPYVGRLLPDAYESPKVADATIYTSAFEMSVIPAVQEAGSFSVALDEVVDKKIVRFDYARASGETLPMIAYVRPSGRLFVGVSYCPPCEGEGQRIETDGTLTCSSCGTRRTLEDNAGLSGACKLYPLDEVPVIVDGNNILIDGTTLDAWTAQPLDRPVG